MADDNCTTATKRCSSCKEHLSASLFNKNRSKRDGIADSCRECMKAYLKKYHAANLEAHAERMREHYQANKEAYKARSRKWERDNIERKRELRARYRERNQEKIRVFSQVDWQKHNEKRLAKKKVYRTENPEKGMAHVRKRQARKLSAMPEWADRKKIEAFYKLASDLSRSTGVMHHVDHIYPLQGSKVCGLHNEFNLQVITAAENHAKGNRMPE